MTLIFVILECWRPFYFLTDDNLDYKLGCFIEVGNNLLSGRSPFVSLHLFGGDYNLLRDPSFFDWHPFYLLVALLAGTPFYAAIIDINVFALLLLNAAGFVVLAESLRRDKTVAASDGWILFYALSFTFSMVTLGVGPNWMEWMANQSALPWLVLGMLQRSWRSGLGLVTLFSVHEVLGGHMEPTIFNSAFLSLFALGMSRARRSWLPLAIWAGGSFAALVIVLPLLLPVIGGFLATSRAEGATLQAMTAYRIPPWEFVPDVFAGSFHWLLSPYNQSQAVSESELGASAAAWCLIAAFASRAKWRGLEVTCMGMMLLAALMVCLPDWLGQGMLHVPILRSLRLPFREFLQLQFFMHLFLLARPPGLPALARRTMALFGACLFVLGAAAYWPPSFSPMNLDRQLVIHGGMERWWQQVRPFLKPGDRVVSILPEKVYIDGRYDRAWCLLGAFNYAPLAGVVNASGYSMTVPRDQLYLKTVPAYYFGAYTPDQKGEVLAERPEVKFLTLESWQPLKITLSSQNGPTVDLTPFVPPGVKGVNVK